MISTNAVIVNEIISDITIRIQEELNSNHNSKFSIKLGSLTGTRILASKGPELRIEMSTVGNIETGLKSELNSVGINQTMHKIYLEVECEVSVLTPFSTIDEKIINQILLTEAVIIGTTPNTYYNFEGMNEKNTLETIN